MITTEGSFRRAPPLRILAVDALVPEAWRNDFDPARSYVFNPSIATHDGGRILTYRVVLPDGRRRIAICRLDGDLRVVPGSPLPLSDLLVAGGDWHADPRLCSFGDRLVLHFNNGARVPNDIFLVELDPRTLRPLGPCRTTTLEAARQPVEKNWMFFAHDGVLYTVYSVAPHRVCRVDLDAPGPVRCTPAWCTDWSGGSVVARYGRQRGSSPPVRLGECYWSFFHVRYQKPLGRRFLGTALHGHHLHAATYGTGVYAFRAEPPFAPTLCSPGLLFGPPLRPRSPRPALSPWTDSALYASGAILDGPDWIVSFGVHDDGCGFMHFGLAEVFGFMKPVVPD